MYWAADVGACLLCGDRVNAKAIWYGFDLKFFRHDYIRGEVQMDDRFGGKKRELAPIEVL